MSLEQQLADRLRDNYVRFTTDLCVDPELCSYFIQDRVFTENNKDDVMFPRKPQEKTAEFLKLVKTRGEKGYTTFVKALVETSQDDLADLLDRRLADEYRLIIDGPVPPHHQPVGHARPASARDSCSTRPIQETCSPLTDRILKVSSFREKKIPIDLIKLEPHHDIIKRMRRENDEDLYRMRNGFAVIVNNYEFVNGNIRKGSEHDLDNLHNLLEELNFVVHIDTDLTAQALKDKMVWYASCEELLDVDVFLLCVMSHGIENSVMGTDRKKVNLKEDIMKPFENCDNLKAKPKIVIIQACQGALSSTTATHPDSSTDATPEPREDIMGQDIHPEQDFLFVSSTCPGDKSFREEWGTWFIRAFVMEMHNHCHEKHLGDIITKVISSVKECRAIGDYYKNMQLPFQTSKFAKELYLCAVNGSQ